MIVTIFIITGFTGTSNIAGYDQALNSAKGLDSGIKTFFHLRA
jgi:hypothetical protein